MAGTETSGLSISEYDYITAWTIGKNMVDCYHELSINEASHFVSLPAPQNQEKEVMKKIAFERLCPESKEILKIIYYSDWEEFSVKNRTRASKAKMMSYIYKKWGSEKKRKIVRELKNFIKFL